MIPTLKWKRSKSSLNSPKEPTPPSSLSSSSPPSTFHSFLQKTKDSTSTNSNTSRISSKDRKNKDKHPPQVVSSALIIPEVVLSIAHFLNRSTLAQCTRVCKHWNAIFQPLLFRYIESTDFDRPDFVQAFHQYSRFATSIEWIQEPIRAPSPKKHAWHKIFRRRAEKPAPQKQFEQLEQSLAGETPALETLSVRIQNLDPNIILRLPASTVVNLQISTRGYPAKKPKVYMEDILASYPHLVNLTLEGLFTLTTRLVDSSQQGSESTIYPPPALLMNNQNNIVATLFPMSTTVTSNAVPPPGSIQGGATTTTPTTITTGSLGSGEGMISDLAVMPPSSSSSSISSLSTTSTTSSTSASTTRALTTNIRTCSLIEALKLRLVDVSQEGLLALSAFLPRLESLLIEEFLVPDMMIKIYRWTWSTEFIHSLKESFPHLRVLRLAIPFDVIKEDTIVEILKSFPNLTTVGFRNSYFGQRALKTMQECCKNVDCLDISFGFSSREFKRDLLLFLQANTLLREFEADGMIFHLDRSAEDEDEDDMVVGGPNHSVPQPLVLPWACTKLEKLVCGFQGTDSAIFQFLSRFPLLENLTVTYPSLNLTPVESTLGWLAKSNKIKYFWFSQYRHLPMDKSSIQWMLTHWPNLKTLHVAGGGFMQREAIRQMFKDAQRLSVHVEYDRM